MADVNKSIEKIIDVLNDIAMVLVSKTVPTLTIEEYASIDRRLYEARCELEEIKENNQ